MPDICICRVIGNELPPRDPIGTKLKSLKFVLQQDVPLNAPRRWILNRIIDRDYLAEVKACLFGEIIYEIPFVRSDYKNSRSHDQKIKYLTNINPARNELIRRTHQNFRFAASLDQDCFFDKPNWDHILQYIENDQSKKYYGLVSKRITSLDKIWEEPNNEPMVIFRDDANPLFDESLMFGQDDKRTLLFNLGYNRNWEISGESCKTAGYVLHIGFNDEIEKDTIQRVKARQEGLDNLVAKADKLCKIPMI